MLYGKINGSTFGGIEQYGLVIDESISHPKRAVSYLDESVVAVDIQNKSLGSWEYFIKRYLSTYVTLDLETKEEIQQIDPNNWTKTTSGERAVLDGSKGDLMWKVPKLYWKIEKNGDKVYVDLSDTKLDDDYVCLAHTMGDKEVDYIYYGVFLSVEKDGRLRSIGYEYPYTHQNRAKVRNMSEINGKNVHIVPYYPWLLYQIIILMLGANRDTQSQWGHGYAEGIFSNDETQVSVSSNAGSGMFYHSKEGVNAFIADPWGHRGCWIDGYQSKWITGGLHPIFTATTNFNEELDGYELKGHSNQTEGCVSKVYGTSDLGFIPVEAVGFETSLYNNYYADDAWVQPGLTPVVGGNGGTNVYKKAGAFYFGERSSQVTRFASRLFVYGE